MKLKKKIRNIKEVKNQLSTETILQVFSYDYYLIWHIKTEVEKTLISKKGIK